MTAVLVPLLLVAGALTGYTWLLVQVVRDRAAQERRKAVRTAYMLGRADEREARATVRLLPQQREGS